MRLIVSDQDIENCFKTPKFENKFRRLGEYLKPLVSQVFLLSQLEAENGEASYLQLKEHFGDLISTERNGCNLFKDAEQSLPHALALTLYAVWTSIYAYNQDAEESFWKSFYDGLTYVKKNPVYNEKTGQAIRLVFKHFENLVDFPEVDQETSWVHISPIILHGLPQPHITRLINEIVLTESSQWLSVESQLQEWLYLMDQKLFPKSTLKRFFKYGGDAARIFTQTLMDMRDDWNEQGHLPEQVLSLPEYILNLFKASAQSTLVKPQTFRQRKLPSSKPPVLLLNLERELQPFLYIPQRRAMTRPFEASISASSIGKPKGFAAEIQLQTYLIEGDRYSRDAVPEEGEFREALLVPPAAEYRVRFSGDNVPYSIEIPHHHVLVFDARSGQLLDLRQDIRWPEELVVLYTKGSYLSSNALPDGFEPDEQPHLNQSWSDWQYVILRNAHYLKWQGSDGKTQSYQARRRQKPLCLDLNLTNPAPHWVHLPSGLELVSELSELTCSVTGLQPGQRAFFSLKRQGQRSKIISNRSVDAANSDFSLNCELQPGLYHAQIDAGMDSSERQFLYLPGAAFERSPDQCTFVKATALKVQLPGLCPKEDWQILQTADEHIGIKLTAQGFALEYPNLTALGLSLFKDTAQEITLFLILTDVRWRFYGHARIPHLREMHSDLQELALHQLEDLKDQRLRIEAELPVYDRLQRQKGQVMVQARNFSNEVIVSGRSAVRYHQYAYWDIDMLRFAREAKDLNHDLQAVVGLAIGAEFRAVVSLGLRLKLANLKIEHVDFVNQDVASAGKSLAEEQVIEKLKLSWDVTPADPSAARFQFRVCSLENPVKSHTLQAFDAQDGALYIELPAIEDTETWGLYPEYKQEQNNPFAAISPFSTDKTQVKWTRKGFIHQSTKVTLKGLSSQRLMYTDAWQETGVIMLDAKTPVALADLVMLAYPPQQRNACVQATLKRLANNDFEYVLPGLPDPAVWHYEIYVQATEQIKQKIHAATFRRLGYDINFEEVTIEARDTLYPNVLYLKWKGETPAFEGPLYLIYADKQEQNIRWSEAQAKGTSAKVKLLDLQEKCQYKSYLSLNKPRSHKGKYVFEAPEHLLGFSGRPASDDAHFLKAKIEAEVRPIRCDLIGNKKYKSKNKSKTKTKSKNKAETKTKSVSSLEDLAVLRTNIALKDDPAKDLEIYCDDLRWGISNTFTRPQNKHWLAFLETFHLYPEQIFDAIGEKAFLAVSPFSEQRRFILQHRQPGLKRKSYAYPAYRLRDLSDDYYLFRTVDPKEPSAFYQLTNRQNSIAALDLKINQCDDVYRFYWKGSRLCVRAVKKSVARSVEQGNGRFELLLKAELPLNLWVYPEKWLPLCLYGLKKLTQEQSLDYTSVQRTQIFNTYDICHNMIKNLFENSNNYILGLWLNCRFKNAHSPDEYLQAITGSLALILRLLAYLDLFPARSSGFQVTHLKSISKRLIAQLKNCLFTNSKAQIRYWLLRDAMLAEIFFYWYWNTEIARSTHYLVDNPENILLYIDLKNKK